MRAPEPVVRAVAVVDRGIEIAITLLTAVIVVTIAADVVARYGFSQSLLFANELSRLCFIWASFLFMPLGIARGMHVSITSLETMLPPMVRALVFRAGLAAVAAVMVAVLIGGVVSVQARAAEQLMSIPISAAWFFAPLVIGAGWSLVHLALSAVRGERTVRAVEGEAQ